MSISSVTSEALQLKIRQLLPSQQGFGTDLSASDTIIPIIDLTSAAEGSDVSENLQTALNFGGVTPFDVSNTTTVIQNSQGFYRLFGSVAIASSTSAYEQASVVINDGSTDKVLVIYRGLIGGFAITQTSFDFNVWLSLGDSLKIISGSGNVIIGGCSRQIADSNGTLVQPVGFTPQ